MNKHLPDVTVTYCGNIYILKPMNEDAIAWIEQNVPRDEHSWQPYYPSLLVEHRYLDDIICGMEDDGLLVNG